MASDVSLAAVIKEAIQRVKDLDTELRAADDAQARNNILHRELALVWDFIADSNEWRLAQQQQIIQKIYDKKKEDAQINALGEDCMLAHFALFELIDMFGSNKMENENPDLREYVDAIKENRKVNEDALTLDITEEMNVEDPALPEEAATSEVAPPIPQPSQEPTPTADAETTPPETPTSLREPTLDIEPEGIDSAAIDTALETIVEPPENAEAIQKRFNNLEAELMDATSTEQRKEIIQREQVMDSGFNTDSWDSMSDSDKQALIDKALKDTTKPTMKSEKFHELDAIYKALNGEPSFQWLSERIGWLDQPADTVRVYKLFESLKDDLTELSPAGRDDFMKDKLDTYKTKRSQGYRDHDTILHALNGTSHDKWLAQAVAALDGQAPEAIARPTTPPPAESAIPKGDETPSPLAAPAIAHTRIDPNNFDKSSLRDPVFQDAAAVDNLEEKAKLLEQRLQALQQDKTFNSSAGTLSNEKAERLDRDMNTIQQSISFLAQFRASNEGMRIDLLQTRKNNLIEDIRNTQKSLTSGDIEGALLPSEIEGFLIDIHNISKEIDERTLARNNFMRDYAPALKALGLDKLMQNQPIASAPEPANPSQKQQNSATGSSKKATPPSAGEENAEKPKADGDNPGEENGEKPKPDGDNPGEENDEKPKTGVADGGNQPPPPPPAGEKPKPDGDNTEAMTAKKLEEEIAERMRNYEQAFDERGKGIFSKIYRNTFMRLNYWFTAGAYQKNRDQMIKNRDFANEATNLHRQDYRRKREMKFNAQADKQGDKLKTLESKIYANKYASIFEQINYYQKQIDDGKITKQDRVQEAQDKIAKAKDRLHKLVRQEVINSDTDTDKIHARERHKAIEREEEKEKKLRKKAQRAEKKIKREEEREQQKKSQKPEQAEEVTELHANSTAQRRHTPTLMPNPSASTRQNPTPSPNGQETKEQFGSAAEFQEPISVEATGNIDLSALDDETRKIIKNSLENDPT